MLTTCPSRLTSATRPAIEEFLDSAHDHVLARDFDALERDVTVINDLRIALTHEQWVALTQDVVRAHPLHTRFLEEPFTRRAFTKPRGYAGDAPMLDLVFSEGPAPDRLSALGRDLYLWTMRQPGCRSVVYRRDFLASVLDDVARDYESARVLSLACGHMREAGHSYAVRTRAICEIVAMDQDLESLAEVQRSLGAYRVTPTPGSVRDVLAGSLAQRPFDFIYSAGLYDYLADTVAVALTRALFQSLRPGGRMLLANFAPSLRDIGYMEAIMDWQLRYRDEAAVRRFADAISPDELISVDTFRDAPGNVVYLDIRKE